MHLYTHVIKSLVRDFCAPQIHATRNIRGSVRMGSIKLEVFM